MTQSIVVQVGQCGNQIGCRFWDLALREHAQCNKAGVYDEPLSTFFRNVDTRHGKATNIPLRDGRGKIRALKARAVLVDMEESVVAEALRGNLGEIFDHRQLITDVSGSGNNWAVGNKLYGSRYQEQILETLRKEAEQCDCLQSFFILHSMGGGTGSGVGTKVLELIQDEYPEAYRFATAVFPSAEDDVITSPYNSVLAMHELTERADCVFPIENQALIELCQKVSKAVISGKGVSRGAVNSGKAVPAKEKPFDTMNNIVANLLLSLTGASRFEGSLNVDLNEITMNLVPFPRLHYLISALSPLYTSPDLSLPPRKLDQAFSDCFSRDYQLIKADPKNSLYLACALMVRGKVSMSDIRRNIERLQPSLSFVHWNQQGWKTGICSVPPIGQTYSILTLANNTCFNQTLAGIKASFNKLYRRKAHLHHYCGVEGMEESLFEESLSSLNSLMADYEGLQATMGQMQMDTPRLKIC